MIVCFEGPGVLVSGAWLTEMQGLHVGTCSRRVPRRRRLWVQQTSWQALPRRRLGHNKAARVVLSFRRLTTCSAPVGPPRPSPSPACDHTSTRFRKPKHSYQHHKSEVSSRHSAFTRGSAYLERYCLLIAFGAYLEEVTAGVFVDVCVQGLRV